MKAIKLFDGVLVTINGQEEFYDDMKKMFEDLRIESREIQGSVIRSLLCFNTLCLDDAYPGYEVSLRLIPDRLELEA